MADDAAAARGPTDAQRQELEERGYTILPAGQLCDPEMLPRLRAAAHRVVDAARAADPSVSDLRGGRVLRDRPGQGPWGIRGCIAPGWGEGVFAEYMASEPVLRYVRGFLGCSGDDLMLPDADVLIFTNPPHVDRAQPWHRDVRWWGLRDATRKASGRIAMDEDADFSAAAERARWAEIQGGPGGAWAAGTPRVSGHNDYLVNHGGAYLRWEVALEEQTTGLEIVPGSHRRFRSAYENDCLLPRRAKAAGIGERAGATSTAMSSGRHGGESLMPGATFVRLRPGEAVVWNGDMLHRGRTVAGVERLTLSCSYSRWAGSSAPPPPVIDATVRWKLDPAVRGALRAPWLRRAWDRWLLTQYSPEQIVAKYPGFLPAAVAGEEPAADALAGWRRLCAPPAAAADAAR